MHQSQSTRARRVSLALLAVLGFALAGCSRGPRLQHTLESPDAVARAVVAGLNARDVTSLERLELTQDEFQRLVWPRLPTSRPGRNIPWDYAWNDLHHKSALQLQARLNEWDDRGFAVVRIEFTGETTDYQAFRVRRDSAVTLRDRDGRETRARLFGSMIEQDGRFKVFSYVAD